MVHYIFSKQTICAQCEKDACCDWVGDEGSGHFVKMVHNGIEYGDMQVSLPSDKNHVTFKGSVRSKKLQLIAEAYHLMKDAVGLSHGKMADIFSDWNQGDLDSFLIEITANILRYKDEDGLPLVTKIRDSAGQKGTGKWTAISALDHGVPVTLIAEAVFAR